MIFKSSPIYTFRDPQNKAVCIMIWQIGLDAFTVNITSADNDNGVIERPSILEALNTAAFLVQARGLILHHTSEMPPELGGVTYWEIAT